MAKLVKRTARKTTETHGICGVVKFGDDFSIYFLPTDEGNNERYRIYLREQYLRALAKNILEITKEND